MSLSIKHLLELEDKASKGASLDEEENDFTAARISKKMNTFEKPTSSSRLRALNATRLAHKDPKYKVITVPKHSKMLNADDTSSEDEGSSDGFQDDLGDQMLPDESEDDSDVDIGQIERNLKAIRERASVKTKSRTMSDEDNSSGSESEESIEVSDQEEESKSDWKNVIDSDQEDEEESLQPTNIVRKSQITKEQGQSVQNQLKLCNEFLEIRTLLQKVLPLCNQLPQHPNFSEFIQSDEELQDVAEKANKTAKILIQRFLKLQDSLIKQNTKASSMLENITPVSPKKDNKKHVKHLEKCLNQHHETFTPYRDTILNDCLSKTVMLSRSSFNQFDVSASKQLQNILADKEPLIKRTQLRSISRGNTYKIIGKEDQVVEDVYDDEIFDDTDFYSVLINESGKTKCFSSVAALPSKKELLQSQKEKGKKHHKASKGRRMRTEPIKPMIGFFYQPYTPKLSAQGRDELIRSLFKTPLRKPVIRS